MSSPTIIEGTVMHVTTSTPFTTTAGAAADPTTVHLAWSIAGGEVTELTYSGGSSGTNTIIKAATGSYYADIITEGLPGLWTLSWTGISTNGSVSVVYEWEQLVTPRAVPITL